ncbi:hypothetical protein ACHWQZ_G008415 [Mnemiopsis leidyi]
MANFNFKLDMWQLRNIGDKVTNVVMNYTDAETKVREASNDDPWGPSGTLMQEIARLTYQYTTYDEVMAMLWKRMFENKKNWRRIYKCLLLLAYLVRNGSERAVENARDHLFDLGSLENYTFTDENGKDQGINVRQRVTELIQFLQDDKAIRDERKKARKNRDKYTGVSSDEFSGSGFGPSKARNTGSDYGFQESNLDKLRSFSSGIFDKAKSKWDDEPREDDFKIKDDLSSWKPKTDNWGSGLRKPYKDEDEEESKEEKGFDAVKEEAEDSDDFNFIRSKSSAEDTPKKKAEPSKLLGLGAAANFAQSGERQASAAPAPAQKPFDPFTENAKAEETADLFDFGNDPAPASSQSAAASDPFFGTDSSNNNDGFADFASFQSAPAKEEAPAANGLEADLFGLSLGGPAPAAAAPVPAASTDLFGLTPAPQPQATPAQPADPFAAFSAMSASQPAAQPNLLDDFGGFGSPSNPAHAQTTQPGPPMMNLMPQNNQPLISQSQPIMSTSTNQQFSMQSQQQNPMMYPNQGMMMASQSQGMMPQPAQGRPVQSKPVQSKPEVQSKSGLWNVSGLDISLDNLTGTGPKQNRGVPMSQMMPVPQYSQYGGMPHGGGPMNFPQGGMQMGGMPNMMPMQQQQGMQNFGQFNQMPQQQQQNFFPMGGNAGFNQPAGGFNNQQGFQQLGKLS